MKRKVASLMIALLTFVSVSTTGFALEKDNLISGNYGIMVADDGTQCIVKGEVIATSEIQKTGGGKSVTFKYDIPEPIKRGTGGSWTEYDVDGAKVSTVYLTVDYLTKNTPTEYLLTGVSGHWVLNDSRVTVPSASLSYGCSGLFPSPVTQSVQNRLVGNYFSINTGFTKYVAGDVQAIVGANLTVNYRMGTSRTWSFTIVNNIVDFNSGWD